eukprot:TRINITY_DN2291_c0_g2_i1.p1 TRINITY_DN2291_c0_g2~~TRINITY_DN2291_c0_g2_i1.p1  ORF type:complete len:2126 (+),score=465.97 TRINITY_DN2291_c0_g2_i1:474-6380(+)
MFSRMGHPDAGSSAAAPPAATAAGGAPGGLPAYQPAPTPGSEPPGGAGFALFSRMGRPTPTTEGGDGATDGGASAQPVPTEAARADGAAAPAQPAAAAGSTVPGGAPPAGVEPPAVSTNGGSAQPPAADAGAGRARKVEQDKCDAAATTIQRRVRGSRARSQTRERRAKQRAAVGARGSEQRSKSAGAVPPSRERQALSRVQLSAEQQDRCREVAQEEAARVIQNAHRRHSARIARDRRRGETQKSRDKVRRDEAATVIQTAQRGHHARQTVFQRRLQLREVLIRDAQASQQIPHFEAAAAVDAAFRDILEDEIRRLHALRTLQRVARGCQGRRRAAGERRRQGSPPPVARITAEPHAHRQQVRRGRSAAAELELLHRLLQGLQQEQTGTSGRPVKGSVVEQMGTAVVRCQDSLLSETRELRSSITQLKQQVAEQQLAAAELAGARELCIQQQQRFASSVDGLQVTTERLCAALNSKLDLEQQLKQRSEELENLDAAFRGLQVCLDDARDAQDRQEQELREKQARLKRVEEGYASKHTALLMQQLELEASRNSLERYVEASAHLQGLYAAALAEERQIRAELHRQGACTALEAPGAAAQGASAAGADHPGYPPESVPQRVPGLGLLLEVAFTGPAVDCPGLTRLTEVVDIDYFAEGDFVEVLLDPAPGQLQRWRCAVVTAAEPLQVHCPASSAVGSWSRIRHVADARRHRWMLRVSRSKQAAALLQLERQLETAEATLRQTAADASAATAAGGPAAEAPEWLFSLLGEIDEPKRAATGPAPSTGLPIMSPIPGLPGMNLASPNSVAASPGTSNASPSGPSHTPAPGTVPLPDYGSPAAMDTQDSARTEPGSRDAYAERTDAGASYAGSPSMTPRGSYLTAPVASGKDWSSAATQGATTCAFSRAQSERSAASPAPRLETLGVRMSTGPCSTPLPAVNSGVAWSTASTLPGSQPPVLSCAMSDAAPVQGVLPEVEREEELDRTGLEEGEDFERNVDIAEAERASVGTVEQRISAFVWEEGTTRGTEESRWADGMQSTAAAERQERVQLQSRADLYAAERSGRDAVGEAERAERAQLPALPSATELRLADAQRRHEIEQVQRRRDAAFRAFYEAEDSGRQALIWAWQGAAEGSARQAYRTIPPAGPVTLPRAALHTPTPPEVPAPPPRGDRPAPRRAEAGSRAPPQRAAPGAAGTAPREGALTVTQEVRRDACVERERSQREREIAAEATARRLLREQERVRAAATRSAVRAASADAMAQAAWRAGSAEVATVGSGRTAAAVIRKGGYCLLDPDEPLRSADDTDGWPAAKRREVEMARREVATAAVLESAHRAAVHSGAAEQGDALRASDVDHAVALLRDAAPPLPVARACERWIALLDATLQDVMEGRALSTRERAAPRPPTRNWDEVYRTPRRLRQLLGGEPALLLVLSAAFLDPSEYAGFLSAMLQALLRARQLFFGFRQAREVSHLFGMWDSCSRGALLAADVAAVTRDVIGNARERAAAAAAAAAPTAAPAVPGVRRSVAQQAEPGPEFPALEGLAEVELYRFHAHFGVTFASEAADPAVFSNVIRRFRSAVRSRRGDAAALSLAAMGSRRERRKIAEREEALRVASEELTPEQLRAAAAATKPPGAPSAELEAVGEAVCLLAALHGEPAAVRGGYWQLVADCIIAHADELVSELQGWSWAAVPPRHAARAAALVPASLSRADSRVQPLAAWARAAARVACAEHRVHPALSPDSAAPPHALAAAAAEEWIAPACPQYGSFAVDRSAVINARRLLVSHLGAGLNAAPRPDGDPLGSPCASAAREHASAVPAAMQVQRYTASSPCPLSPRSGVVHPEVSMWALETASTADSTGAAAAAALWRSSSPEQSSRLRGHTSASPVSSVGYYTATPAPPPRRSGHAHWAQQDVLSHRGRVCGGSSISGPQRPATAGARRPLGAQHPQGPAGAAATPQRSASGDLGRRPQTPQ